MTRRQFFAAFVAGLMGIGLAIKTVEPKVELWGDSCFYAEFPHAVASLTFSEHDQLLLVLANGDNYIGSLRSANGGFRKIEVREFIGDQFTVAV